MGRSRLTRCRDSHGSSLLPGEARARIASGCVRQEISFASVREAALEPAGVVCGGEARGSVRVAGAEGSPAEGSLEAEGSPEAAGIGPPGDNICSLLSALEFSFVPPSRS